MLNIGTDGSIHMTRGDTARFSVSIDDTISETSYELAETDTLTMTVKKSVNDETPYIQKTITGSNLFHIEPTDTQKMRFGNYLYDVQLTTEHGDVYTIIPPTIFEILKEVTY